MLEEYQAVVAVRRRVSLCPLGAVVYVPWRPLLLYRVF